MCSIQTGTTDKCPDPPKVPYIPGKWYWFNHDLQCTSLCTSEPTTHYDIYPWSAYTIDTYQPKFITGLCDTEPSIALGNCSEEPKGPKKVKVYDMIVIHLHDGKYKFEWNLNGFFTLYEKQTADWHHLETLPPCPDHFNLDEFIWEVGERISQLYEKTQPVPGTEPQGATCVEKMELAPEPVSQGPPNVQIMKSNWKKGELMQKYLTKMKQEQWHEISHPEEYCMMTMEMEQIAGLAQWWHEVVDPTKIFMVTLQPAYDPNCSIFAQKGTFRGYPKPQWVFGDEYYLYVCQYKII